MDNTLMHSHKSCYGIILILLGIVLAGCQLPTANYFRDQVFPQETLPKVLLSPIILPTYGFLCIADITIVNPIRGCANIPDTTSSIWQWQNKPNPTTGNLLIPVKLIAIPPAGLATMMFSEQFTYRDTPIKDTNKVP